MTSLGPPGSVCDIPGCASDMSGSTSNHSRAVWGKHHLLWECCWCPWKSYLLLIIQQFLKLMYSVCILIYVTMYLYSYPSIHDVSGLATGGAREQFKVCQKMTIEWTQGVIKSVWRCNWRLWLSELTDAQEGHDWTSLEMHLEAKVEWTQICTLRLWSSKFEDAMGDQDWVNSEMLLQAMIEQLWRCAGRPWSSKFGDALEGRGWVNSKMDFEAVIERVWRSNWRPRLS